MTSNRTLRSRIRREGGSRVVSITRLLPRDWQEVEIEVAYSSDTCSVLCVYRKDGLTPTYNAKDLLQALWAAMEFQAEIESAPARENQASG